MTDIIKNNAERSRYELDVEGSVAIADYTLSPGIVTISYTEVPAALRGRSIGGRLARAMLEDIRKHGLKVVPRCGFLRAFIRDNPEFMDLLA